MTIRDIRIFMTVCECDNNLSKAARTLYMTQPSVSLAIQEIEKEYDILLFDRIQHRLYLTQAGKELRDYAQRILSLYDEMDRQLHSWNHNGTLFAGASMTIGSELMPQYVQSFETKYPGLQVRVLVEHSVELEKKLLSNDLDLALLETPMSSELLHSVKFMEDSLEIVAPPSAGWRQDQTITADELVSSRILLREKGSGTREIFEREMAARDLFMTPAWEASSTTALIHAVELGMGLSVLPGSIVRPEIRAGRMVRVHVEGIEFRQNFYIVTHKDKVITPMIQAFMNVVESRQQRSV